MTAITEADYARMPWHARQALNRRLEAETKRLTADITRLRSLRAKARTTSTIAETTQADARRILASLPVDPNAAAHRLALVRELGRHGKATP